MKTLQEIENDVLIRIYEHEYLNKHCKTNINNNLYSDREVRAWGM